MTLTTATLPRKTEQKSEAKSTLSLATKAALAAAILCGGLFALAYGVTHTILIRSFADLEKQQVLRDLTRASNALSADISALGHVTREWGTWDDMYAYVETKDPRFEASNLTESNYFEARLGAVLIFDTARRVVYGRAFDRSTKTFAATPEALAAYLGRQPKIIDPQQQQPEASSGLVLLSGAPWIFAARPVLKGDGTGPPRGTVVLARLLDQEQVRNLAEGTRLALAVEPLQTVADTQGEPSVEVVGAGEVVGKSVFRDFSGSAGIRLVIRQQREIVQRGRRALAMVGFGLFGIALLIGAAGWLVHRGIQRYLRAIVGRLSDTAAKVEEAAGELSSGSGVVAAGSAQQSTAIEEAAAALASVVDLTRRNNEHLEGSNSRMLAAGEAMKHADELTSRVRDVITGVRGRAEHMRGIVKTIEDIAFQTNILSLNAAIEAARAGGAGAGFAVVADEVRRLAHSSSDAAQQTGRLIEDAVSEIVRVAEMAQSAQTVFGEARDQRQQAEQLLSGIAAGVQEQAARTEEISRLMAGVEAVTHQNAAAAEQTSASAGSLQAESSQVNQIVTGLVRMFGGQESRSVA